MFRNTLRVKWEVDDQESYIQRQYLSISSHKGGRFNTSSMEVIRVPFSEINDEYDTWGNSINNARKTKRNAIINNKCYLRMPIL